jgi:anhydro-N-acetylmuramic acid kinase
MSYYIGLMSGTSLDAVDAALVDFSDSHPRLVKAINVPLPEALRKAIKDLCSPADNEIERMGIVDVQLATLFAQAVTQLLQETHTDARQISAIGSHGQTIRHRPAQTSSFTLQIGDPNTLAELTGITTVADFRRRDVAAGGQGAPLVPAFHAASFSSEHDSRVILNIGGIANVTLLVKEKEAFTTGFDTGPGNVLMDAWIHRHQQQAYDKNGQWAASGEVDTDLLSHLLTDKFFTQPPPKSTGREDFNIEWLDARLDDFGVTLRPVDVIATLAELTASSIQHSIHQYAESSTQLIVCGGGCRNGHLMSRLQALLPTRRVISSDELGLAAEWVEAVAFAWLARETLAQRPGNRPAVTGAKHAAILGGIYWGTY